MDIETLEKGQELLKSINELKKRIKILENGYVNSIQGWDYSYSSDGERVVFPLEGELRDHVIRFIKRELKEVEDEFERL